MGENTLALLAHLTSPSADISNIKHSMSTVFFSAWGGRLFFLYSKSTALRAYASMSAILVALIARSVPRHSGRQYAMAALAAPASLVAGLISANAVALFLDVVVGKPMSWYRRYAIQRPGVAPVTYQLRQGDLSAPRLQSPCARWQSAGASRTRPALCQGWQRRVDRARRADRPSQLCRRDRRLGSGLWRRVCLRRGNQSGIIVGRLARQRSRPFAHEPARPAQPGPCPRFLRCLCAFRPDYSSSLRADEPPRLRRSRSGSRVCLVAWTSSPRSPAGWASSRRSTSSSPRLWLS